MNIDKSSIDSFNVSLGKTKSGDPARPDKQLRPWNVLICSDLGFKSGKPRRIQIAEWNEFMATAGITISGNVEQAPLSSSSPLFVEFGVTAMKDFSAEALKLRVAGFSEFSGLLDSVAGFIEGKADQDHVISALHATTIPKAEKDRVLLMIGALKPDQATRQEPRRYAGASAVDSILSMVDISGSTPDQSLEPHKAIEGLLSSFSDKKGPRADKAACRAFLDAGKNTLNAQIAALCGSPFFADRKASWQSLMQCVKAVGRSKEIHLNVFSTAADDRDEILELLAADDGDSNESPDIIIWDFPVSFTNAEIDRLTRLAVAADRYKSIAIVPVSSNDRLFNSIEARNDFSPVFDDVRFLPFKKLRTSLESRALCLCGPDMMVPDANPAQNGAQATCPSKTHPCWLLVLRWIEPVIGNNDPFAIEVSANIQETILPEDVSFYPDVPESMCEEASALGGINLLNGKPVKATIDRTKTVIDPEIAGTAYTSLAFNLLVNRIARLTGQRIAENSASMQTSEIASDIKEFLCTELIAGRVCASPDQISVKSENNGALDISLNSDVLVGGHPARFSFSLNF
jgi:hypothetical protein